MKENRFSESKDIAIKTLSEDIKNSKSIALVGIERVPGKQFQQIRKSLRGKAKIKVIKKTLLKRAFEGMNSDAIKGMEDYMDGPVAAIFSQENPFKLFKEIESSRTRAPAKGGEIAPDDIVLEAKATNLKPGPVVGELQKAGIPASIDQGKVVIRKETVLVKRGDKITKEKAIALSKLEILPLEIGLDFRAAYEEGIVFDKSILGSSTQDFLNKLTAAHSMAIALSINLNYYTEETMPIFLFKAYREGTALSLAVSYPTKDTVQMLLAKGNAIAKSLEIRFPRSA
ncbi:MAG: 50S ribosomal protein L10 [Thermoplasmatales archaeon]|jgi:large subunit ribosomal protein L10|nr:50S ribosomal protein L10 [Candidatus Thermoplasmatota archaeon]MCL6002784.1 50S ribosomal protein L10 [Candidatus Thermoplasmatota archaeon]MDA8056141.1 50S ribosomal protein L10 [Thermoplasmatales archaeon]